nr:MAG TPA: hypothetical protein [Caudoviricetes sp.]
MSRIISKFFRFFFVFLFLPFLATPVFVHFVLVLVL